MDFTGRIALALAKAFGELKFDAVVLSDPELAPLQPGQYTSIQPVLKTLCNLLNFYDAPLIIQTGVVTPDGLPDLFQLEADGYCTANPISDIINLSPAGILLGGAIPPSILTGAADDVEKAVLELLDKGKNSKLFITTEGELPAAAPASNMHRVMQVLNR